MALFLLPLCPPCEFGITHGFAGFEPIEFCEGRSIAGEIACARLAMFEDAPAACGVWAKGVEISNDCALMCHVIPACWRSERSLFVDLLRGTA